MKEYKIKDEYNDVHYYKGYHILEAIGSFYEGQGYIEIKSIKEL